MLDLISIGGICIDLFFRGKKIPHDNTNFNLKIGDKYTTDYFYEGVGGSGVNVGAAAVQGGLSAAVLGFVGDNPFKEILLTRISQLNISSEYVQIKDTYLNISSIFLTESGERTIVNYKPTHDSLYSAQFDPSSLLSAQAFYLGNLPDVPVPERTTLLTYLKKHGKFIFF